MQVSARARASAADRFYQPSYLCSACRRYSSDNLASKDSYCETIAKCKWLLVHGVEVAVADVHVHSAGHPIGLDSMCE